LSDLTGVTHSRSLEVNNMGKVSNSNQKLEKNKHDWGAKKMELIV